MKDFEYYIGENEVKKQSPDVNLARALFEDARRRFEYASGSKISEKSAKYIYEDVYDARREAIDALLALHGFKSYSHAAAISFLAKLGFPPGEMESLDRMRKRRNGMKYYGKSCSENDVEEAMKFAETLLKKMLEIRKRLV